MIVVMIIGLLAMIAIPNVRKYMETSRYQAIIANLKAIELAKTTWAAENRKPDNTVPSETDLSPYFQGDKFPFPVAGETYNIKSIAERPTATVPAKMKNVEAGGEISLNDAGK
jgi:Tfp pilus assembly protein FimT